MVELITYCSVNPACLKNWILCVTPKVKSQFWLSAHGYFVIKDRTYLLHSLISVRHVKNANPADHKSMTWNTIFFPCFCNSENLWLTNGHFTTISGHYFANCTWIRWSFWGAYCLVCLNLDLIKSNNKLLVKVRVF